MSLDYEFAPIDVNITTHPKAFAAGVEAMGLWLWGQAHAKQQRTGGRLTRAAVFGAWGGRRNVALAKRLVTAGLWLAREDGDWDIYKFKEKGPGREDVASPSENHSSKSTERVRRHREKVKHETGETAFRGTGETAFRGTFPSVSVSSDLVSSLSSDAGAREVVPPPWWADVLGVVAMGTGIELPPVPAWLRYEGHRAMKGIPPSPPDARYWLTTVLVREALDESEKIQHRADREAKWDQERRDAPPKAVLRAVPDTPPAPYHRVNREAEAERAAWEADAGTPAERAEAARKALAELG